MTGVLPASVVDAHVHWWDPFGEWMQMASPALAAELRMGDISPMLAKDYTPADYRADVADYPVDKVVWVMATLDPARHLDEVDYVQRIAGDDPLFAAMIGSIDPALDMGERADALARQAEFPQFRGVRVIGGLPYGTPVADDYLRMLSAGGYLYEDMGDYAAMADAAVHARRHPNVTWVVEHCAWPRFLDDPEYMAAWRAGVRTIAAVDTAVCKLSGLAMATHSFHPSAQRAAFDFCVDQFGADRVLYGSNFPVDRNYGSFADAMSMFLDLTAAWSKSERGAFFATNAERVYGI